MVSCDLRSEKQERDLLLRTMAANKVCASAGVRRRAGTSVYAYMCNWILYQVIMPGM